MSSKNRPLATLLTLFLMIVMGFGRSAGSQPPNDAIPSIATLKLLDYAKAADDKQSDAIGYGELQDLINAWQGYSKGLEILPRFHDPILTRGDTGILLKKESLCSASL